MKTITADQLFRRLEARDPIRLIDVLSRDHYETVHLPGAENIPGDELPERAPQLLDRDETIVVYCSSFKCQKSPRAAAALDQLGYRDVHDFEGGIAEWRRSGRPLERAQDREAQRAA